MCSCSGVLSVCDELLHYTESDDRDRQCFLVQFSSLASLPEETGGMIACRRSLGLVPGVRL